MAELKKIEEFSSSSSASEFVAGVAGVAANVVRCEEAMEAGIFLVRIIGLWACQTLDDHKDHDAYHAIIAINTKFETVNTAKRGLACRKTLFEPVLIFEKIVCMMLEQRLLLLRWREIHPWDAFRPLRLSICVRD